MGAEAELIDGKYRIVRELGAGGMGTVYLAEHTFLGRKVALKLLKREMMAQPAMAARFQLEAQAASRLDHPNIVRVSDFGKTADGRLYLVMELLEGHPLSKETKGRVAGRERALFVAGELARGLEHAHRAGVVHRDLKPDNVFVDGDRVKILDFGLAKLLEPQKGTKLTHTGSIMGTPEYMAPEQARGEADLDARIDLYALGVILYEMVSGDVPYRGANYNVVIYEILRGEPKPIAVAAPGIDGALARLVMRAIAPARDERFQSATEFLAALAALPKVAGPPAPAVVVARSDSLVDAERPTREVVELASHEYQVVSLAGEGTSPTVAAAPPPRRPASGPEAIAAGIADAQAIPLDLPSTAPSAPSARAAARAVDRAGPSAAPGIAGTIARRVAIRLAVRIGIAVVLALGGAIVGWWKIASPAAQLRPVKVHLANLPRQARLLLDGKPVAGNPLVVPGSRELHELTVERPGRAPRVYAFTPTTDQYIEVE